HSPSSDLYTLSLHDALPILSDVFAIDTCGDVFERPSHHQGGDAARVLHVLDAAPQRAPGFVEGLAVLARDDGRDLIEPLVQDVRSEEHTSELQSLRHLVCRL